MPIQRGDGPMPFSNRTSHKKLSLPYISGGGLPSKHKYHTSVHPSAVSSPSNKLETRVSLKKLFHSRERLKHRLDSELERSGRPGG